MGRLAPERISGTKGLISRPVKVSAQQRAAQSPLKIRRDIANIR
jgi:hypothetical protein